MSNVHFVNGFACRLSPVLSRSYKGNITLTKGFRAQTKTEISIKHMRLFGSELEL